MALELIKVQNFFLKAMGLGWASGAPPLPFRELPGFEYYQYEDPNQNLVLVDLFAGIDQLFFGSTMIWHNGALIWGMHYQGDYGDAADALLQRALFEAYSNGVFLGGRGVDMVDADANLAYHNSTNPSSNFRKFRGFEKIVTNDRRPEVKGECSFWGGALVKLD